jgi:EAL domain-containing protein (putative c-di-GMP-specific phosphodiesterase class I)
MESTELPVLILRELAATGVRLALDDFGTGYSSLAYLKTFPLQRLKVDRAFVAQLESDANDRLLTAAIVSLAHKLGLEVTAEGVETEAQARLLIEQGCDELQGYHFGHPLPPAQCTPLMRTACSAPA